MTTEERWNLKGDYFENCNCEILCPCIVGGGPAVPTEGHCDVAFAFHIQEGDYQGVALDDLNFVVVAYTPALWETATGLSPITSTNVPTSSSGQP